MLRSKQLVLLGAKGKLLLSPQQVVIGDPKDITRTKSPNTIVDQDLDNPQRALKNKGIVDSGCSRHMTGNKAYLVEYQDYNGGPVAFGGSKGYLPGKGKIKTGKLDFEDVCFVKELQHFNLFSVSQMCDKKNKVLFTDTECLVLSPDFKLPDENQVLLRVPRQNNMYSFKLKNIVPTGGLACLIVKATVDESNKWHRRLGHVNFKNLNKLMKGNLVRGLPSKIFQNDHTCVACQKGKQHKASCKAKLVSSISQPLQLLHMDLFGPTSIRSINHKTYCLVITDDFSRDIIEFCGSKGIKREYSNARTPQQNRVAERKNKTLIEAARTMLADSFLPNTFWAEAVSTACYVLNRVLVTKPQNKTPYELITGKIPIISYIRPFGCHVTILNTIDHLGKFEEKSDEGFLVGYSLNSKAFRPVTAENKANKTACPKEANHSAGTQDNIDAENSEMETELAQEYFVLPVWSSYTSTVKSSEAKNGDVKPNGDTGPKINKEPKDQEDQAFLEELEGLKRQKKEANDAAEVFSANMIDFTNLETTVNVSPIPTSRIHSIHPTTQILKDPTLAVQTRSKIERNAFLYGTIDEEVYVSQPPGFVDSKFPKKVYKVEKALYGLHQAPRACTPIETQKPLTKDEEAADVDVYLYRSMIGSLMYLTASRPDIMFAVCACSRYLKGKPKLGLWYPRVSSFDLEAYLDSDYAGANLDRKSTTGGCQFLGRRLISWQCKKQTIVATSTTEAEYVAAANCCGQVLWIQNQMLDYGFNFMNTKIYIDNESTICIVKNPVFHSKTKHIEIRHHFIRDAYDKKLIQVLKIHTDDNVADLLTKAFDVSRFNFLIVNIGMVNTGSPKLSTARPKLSTDSTKIESMKLEAMVEERRIFKCWFHYHTTNGHQFTMSNRHQELASPEQTAPELASPEQTASGKDSSNPLIVDSLLKTIWLSMHRVIATG
ncbi:putative ribonuclease H-like domain-containing protein [Tanacetum coccineum]